jgi:hypothetical protein
MIRIRKRQLDSLAVRDFEDAMAAHLGRYFPRHCEVLGDERIRAIIRLGLAKARGHGLFAERSARLTIDLMCMLGSGFDADPQLPWARAILEDPSIGDETTRVDFLYDRALEYIERVADDYRALVGGPDRSRFFEELRAVWAEPNEPFSPADAGALAERMAARLRAVFPRKAGAIGDALVAGVARHGLAVATRYNLGTPRGAFVCTAMMFVVGSHLDAEPQLPWVAKILNDPEPVEPSARVDRLVEALVPFLRTWLA